MKKNNKKGFTLIELLAVIVILAILATAAFTLVIPRITEARKNSFVTDAASAVDAAEGYFLQHSGVYCVNVDQLIKDGLVKGTIGINAGYVVYSPANGTTGTEFTVAYRNGSYQTKAIAGTGAAKTPTPYKLTDLRDKDGNANADYIADADTTAIAYPTGCAPTSN